MPITSPHLIKFGRWMARRGYAKQTSYEYPYFLQRYIDSFGFEINERTATSEADVQRILSTARLAIRVGGPGADAFNEYDVSRNLQSALRLHVRFVSGIRRKPIRSRWTVAIDVPVRELTKGLREQVSRLIRNTKVTQLVKSNYDGMCQLCGYRLEIAPGKYYCEGHHLRPVGKPHSGDDCVENVICVCPNCHVRLDYSLVEIDVSLLKVSKHLISPASIAYHNRLCRRNNRRES